MSTFTYILSYNPASTNFTLNQLHAFIQSNRHVDSWYLAFSGTYVLKSSVALVDMYPAYRQFFDGSHFILSYAIPSLMTGTLPQHAWDWVNTGQIAAIENKS